MSTAKDPPVDETERTIDVDANSTKDSLLNKVKNPENVCLQDSPSKHLKMTKACTKSTDKASHGSHPEVVKKVGAQLDPQPRPYQSLGLPSLPASYPTLTHANPHYLLLIAAKSMQIKC